jgi:hypothetical protein
MSVQTASVRINGQDYALAYNGSTGKWEATITAPGTTSYNVNAGHYYPVQVTATDNAGNVVIEDDTDATLGASLRLTVKETTKPTVAITAPAGGANVVIGKPTITFQLRDTAGNSGVAIGTLALKIDAGATINNIATGMTVSPVAGGYDCSYVCQTTLSDASHTVTITVNDNDGNLSLTASTTFNVDTIPPALNVTSPANALVTNLASLNVVGTTTDAQTSTPTVTVKLNGVDQGAVTVTTGNFSKTITLAQGANTVIVRSTDTSGLFSEVTRTVTLDTTPPVITAVTMTPSTLNTGTTFTIAVTITD